MSLSSPKQRRPATHSSSNFSSSTTSNQSASSPHPASSSSSFSSQSPSSSHSSTSSASSSPSSSFSSPHSNISLSGEIPSDEAIRRSAAQAASILRREDSLARPSLTELSSTFHKIDPVRPISMDDVAPKHVPSIVILIACTLLYSSLFWLGHQLPIFRHLGDGSVEIVTSAHEVTELPHDEIVHELAAFAFAFAFLFDFLTGVVAFWHDVNRRKLASLLCFINISACTSFILMRLHAFPVHTDFLNRPLLTGRYVQWSCSSSLMMFMINLLAHAPISHRVCAFAVQVGTIWFGFLGTYLPPPYWYWGLLGSTVCWIGTLVSIWKCLTTAMNRALHSQDAVHLKRLRTISMIAWNAFYVVWIFGRAEWVSPSIEEALSVICDTVAKLGISLTLFLCNFLSADRLKLVQELKERNMIVVTEKSLAVQRDAVELRRLVNAALSPEQHSDDAWQAAVFFQHLLARHQRKRQQQLRLSLSRSNSRDKNMGLGAQKAADQPSIQSSATASSSSSTLTISTGADDGMEWEDPFSSSLSLQEIGKRQGSDSNDSGHDSGNSSDSDSETMAAAEIAEQRRLLLRLRAELKDPSKAIATLSDSAKQAAESEYSYLGEPPAVAERADLGLLMKRLETPSVKSAASAAATPGLTQPSASPSQQNPLLQRLWSKLSDLAPSSTHPSDKAARRRTTIAPLGSSDQVDADDVADDGLSDWDDWSLFDDKRKPRLCEAMAAAQDILLLIDNMLAGVAPVALGQILADPPKRFSNMQPLPLFKPSSKQFHLIYLLDSLHDFCLQRAPTLWSDIDLLISFDSTRCPLTLTGCAPDLLFLLLRNMMNHAIAHCCASQRGGMIRLHIDADEVEWSNDGYDMLGDIRVKKLEEINTNTVAFLHSAAAVTAVAPVSPTLSNSSDDGDGKDADAHDAHDEDEGNHFRRVHHLRHHQEWELEGRRDGGIGNDIMAAKAESNASGLSLASIFPSSSSSSSKSRLISPALSSRSSSSSNSSTPLIPSTPSSTMSTLSDVSTSSATSSSTTSSSSSSSTSSTSSRPHHPRRPIVLVILLQFSQRPSSILDGRVSLAPSSASSSPSSSPPSSSTSSPTACWGNGDEFNRSLHSALTLAERLSGSLTVSQPNSANALTGPSICARIPLFGVEMSSSNAPSTPSPLPSSSSSTSSSTKKRSNRNLTTAAPPSSLSALASSSVTSATVATSASSSTSNSGDWQEDEDFIADSCEHLPPKWQLSVPNSAQRVPSWSQYKFGGVRLSSNISPSTINRNNLASPRTKSQSCLSLASSISSASSSTSTPSTSSAPSTTATPTLAGIPIGASLTLRSISETLAASAPPPSAAAASMRLIPMRVALSVRSAALSNSLSVALTAAGANVRILNANPSSASAVSSASTSSWSSSASYSKELIRLVRNRGTNVLIFEPPSGVDDIEFDRALAVAANAASSGHTTSNHPSDPFDPSSYACSPSSSYPSPSSKAYHPTLLIKIQPGFETPQWLFRRHLISSPVQSPRAAHTSNKSVSATKVKSNRSQSGLSEEDTKSTSSSKFTFNERDVSVTAVTDLGQSNQPSPPKYRLPPPHARQRALSTWMRAFHRHHRQQQAAAMQLVSVLSTISINDTQVPSLAKAHSEFDHHSQASTITPSSASDTASFSSLSSSSSLSSLLFAVDLTVAELVLSKPINFPFLLRALQSYSHSLIVLSQDSKIQK